MALACQIERQNVISANNVNTTKTAGKKVTPCYKVLPHNVKQTNLSPFQGFLLKSYVQTACEFHDLNMDFVV